MKNLDKLYKELHEDSFYKNFIRKDSALAIYNTNTSKIIENKYIQVFGGIYEEYTINILLMELLSHFKSLGHKVETPKEFLELCKI